jgi:acetyl-CoA carboxylase/biotin carboxylase 1
MGDTIVDVPGGSNNHNYANVTLIVELARLHGVHAVWAGWGHASENPLLPDTLAKSEPPIKFIGPMGSAMRALGDKIGSTIIAQTAGVPCIAWNGDQIFANYNRNTGYLPEDAYKQASVASATDAYDCAVKIGFPVMIKASEGGGGKGIRRVERADDVAAAYRQVCGEVPGSPIFIMKLVSNSRHLEVQVLADEYGNAIALYGRDCSVQRRHQKIIEEGPPIAALPEVWTEMEKAAVTLAQAVGYSNAGTVEYLYSEVNNKFFFLELNPRLQVEHPVTEMITRVNLPAAQLQIAMGIQLYNIPDIRELYGKNRFEEDVLDSERIIDFEKVSRVPPYGHCIAVRITAENAEAGFKPTSGGIQELNFRSTPNVWGYFSMDSSGSIHEYADSQFGHLFASGIDREQARRNMVLALKELSIRGDISTTVDYISKLIERDDFINNEIDTSWLDEIIQQSHDDSLLSQSLGKSNSLSTPKALNRHLKVVIGATALAYDRCINDEKQFLEALGKGHLPSMSWLSMVRDIELILDGFKYKLRCTRTNTNRFHVSIIPSTGKYIESNIRYLSDGGYLIEVGGKTHVAYLSSKGDAASGMRLTIGGATTAFSPDYDPTKLRTDVAGKLVKKLVADGANVQKGQAYCEIEVMKMFMPLKVTESGKISWCMNEGASISPGDLLACMALSNPENVEKITVFEGDLDIDGWGSQSLPANRDRPHLVLRNSFDLLNSGISGYVLSKENLMKAIDELYHACTDPFLPIYDIEEKLSVLKGRIHSDLFEKLTSILSTYKITCTSGLKQR